MFAEIGRCVFRTSAAVRKRNHRTLSSSTSSGYQSIGSFHADNVENLMSLSEDEYNPPQLPFDSKAVPSEPSFMLDKKEWTFLNHGAFGAALTLGYQRSQEWRHYLELQPLRYFDRDLLPHLVYSARQLAKFMSVQREGIAMVPNVTSAMNTIISGYVDHYKDAARIVVWDVSYGSSKKIAKAYCNNVVEIDFLKHLPTLHEHGEAIFVRALEETITSGSNTDWTNTLLILDQTTSNTAMNLPIEALAKRAKEENMLVAVDGAHGLLVQDLGFLNSDMVDVYAANGHKWLSCPRGVGVLYSPHERIRETILRKPAIVSHGVHDGYFSRFAWDGCRDYTAQLSLPVVLETWGDPSNLRTQIRTKLMKGVEVLQSLWHPESTGPTTIAPMSLHSPMAVVRLPDLIALHNKTSADAKHVQDFLFANNIEVPIKSIQGTLYVRVSCHIHNTLQDFEHLGRIMLKYSP